MGGVQRRGDHKRITAAVVVEGSSPEANGGARAFFVSWACERSV